MRQLAEALFALAQRSRGALRLGDVLHHRDEVARLAALAARERGRDSHPDARAVLAQQLLLARFVPGDFAGVAQAHGEQLVPRVADDFAELVVDPQVAQVERDERHSHGGLVERGTQHLVAVDAAVHRFSLCRPRLTAHPCLPRLPAWLEARGAGSASSRPKLAPTTHRPSTGGSTMPPRRTTACGGSIAAAGM